MRVWDLDPAALCDRHLVGEHAEIHAVRAVLVLGRRGYARHPEVLRWRGKLGALRLRHESAVAEMARRGFKHASPIEEDPSEGSSVQDFYVDEPAKQLAILRAKACPCPIGS